MIRKKELARWLPSPMLFVKQIYVSIKSYLTLPFFVPQENGVQKFFKRNYYTAPDELVFDGSTKGYLSKINGIVNLDKWTELSVIDLGCGCGTLLKWILENGFSIAKYVGIDFSIKTEKGNGKYTFVNDNVNNFDKYIENKETIIFMCNSLCYIDDDTFIEILCKVQEGMTMVIIDPAPNIFWDAHFNGVKPIYRTREIVCSILTEQGYVIDNTISDYLLKIKSRYFGEISYGICAYKQIAR